MKTRTTFFVLAALLALPLVALAQQSSDKARDPRDILTNPRLLARYLQLTPDQVTTTQALFKELRAKVDPLRQAQQGLRQTFYTDLEAASPNPCTVGQDALALHANEEAIKTAFEDFDKKLSASLTPEQLAKYEALKEAARLLGGKDGEDS